MLHVWLPNAMEAPTPVSALLHAATLVTAGVYLIIRTSPILEMVPSSLMVISGVGGITALYGAIAGMYQNDIKRIIAYSTCSQLGLNYIKDNKNSNRDVNDNSSSLLNEPELNSEEDENKKDKVPPKEKCVRVFDPERDTKYNIKSAFRGIPIIYCFVNKINNKSYVGKTNNPWIRFKQYFSQSYIIENSKRIAICGALSKYGLNKFRIIILQILPKGYNKEDITNAEYKWVKEIKPSYNIQAIIDPFKGENHYNYGKSFSEGTKQKIRDSLKGRERSPEVIDKHVEGANKKTVYCYDSSNMKFVRSFDGQRIMVRE